MTKAELIRNMLTTSHTIAECAAAAGCSTAYVRAVRQRTDASGRPRTSAADARFDASHPERGLESLRRWAEANPERYRVVQARNAAKQYHARYGVDMEYTEKRRERVRAYYRRKRAAEQEQAQ